MSTSTVSRELLQAVLAATEDQQRAALKVLCGDTDIPKRSKNSERFLSIGELSRKLGFSASTLWRWNLPSHFSCSRRRYLLSEVVAYLESPEFLYTIRKPK